MVIGLEEMSIEQLTSMAYNTKDPDVLTKLSRHPDLKVRKEVIFNPYTPIDVLEYTSPPDGKYNGFSIFAAIADVVLAAVATAILIIFFINFPFIFLFITNPHYWQDWCYSPAPPVIGNSALWEYNHNMMTQQTNKVKTIMLKIWTLDKKQHFIISWWKVKCFIKGWCDEQAKQSKITNQVRWIFQTKTFTCIYVFIQRVGRRIPGKEYDTWEIMV